MSIPLSVSRVYHTVCLHNIDHYRYTELLSRYLVLILLRTFSEDLDPISHLVLDTRDLDINYHVAMLFGREAWYYSICDPIRDKSWDHMKEMDGRPSTLTSEPGRLNHSYILTKQFRTLYSDPLPREGVMGIVPGTPFWGKSASILTTSTFTAVVKLGDIFALYSITDNIVMAKKKTIVGADQMTNIKRLKKQAYLGNNLHSPCHFV